MRIEIGDLIFHGQPDAAFNGLMVERDGLLGWSSLDEAKNERKERPQGHGSFRRGKLWRPSKPITVSGWVIAKSEAQAYERREWLLGLLTSSDELVMKVITDYSTTWRRVTVEAVDVPDQALPRFRFAIDMTADDPRKYGELVTTFTYLPTAGGGRDWELGWGQSWGAVGDLGRVVARNTGNAETTAVYEVHGGLPGGFLITEVESGREVRDTQPIPLGSILYLDPRTGRASLNNQVDRRLGRKDWWTVPPGGTSTVQFAALGGVVGTPRLVQRFAPASL